MLKIIEKLLLKYDIQEIEYAFVQLFIEINNIKVIHNILIKKILSHNTDSMSSLKSELQKEFKDINLYDLINIFELLIPKNDRKLNGAFFTPKTITSFILKNTITSRENTICDPSCGCGAFLVEAAIFINTNYNKNIIQVIEKNIYGADIADYSVNRAKILLTLLALENKEDASDINFNIISTNSLTINWDEMFLNKLPNNGFDAVIGNPPYVKFQDLAIEIREDLYKNWSTLKNGNYNLYFAFFELGMKLLNPNGILGYITPNNYFTSLAGIDLRNYLESNRLIYKILDFNHLRIFNAQTYTCITFLKNKNEDTFLYERIDEYKRLDNLDDIDYSTMSYLDLNNKKWRLLKNIDQENIKNIETIGNKLGSIVDIRVGVATCKDSVYFIDGKIIKDGFYQKNYNSITYEIECAITKPIAKISDFKNQKELEENKRRIIFPYEKINNNVKVITEDDLKTKYPKCYQYLLAAKEELATRDKGKVKYPEWFSYARTQGLNFVGEKLFTPTFSLEPRFLYEKDVDSMFCNGYAIFLKQTNDLFSINKRLSLPTLAKILNSKIMDYYIKRTSVSIEGGYPCYQKNFIELFGIPNFTDKELATLENETSREIIDIFLAKKYKVKF